MHYHAIRFFVILIFSQVHLESEDAGADVKPHSRGTNDLLVAFHPHTTRVERTRLHKRAGAVVVHSHKSIHVDHVRLDPGMSLDAAIRLYQDSGQVRYVERDHVARHQKNDP